MQQLQYHLSAITHGLMNGNSKRLHKGNKKYSLTANPKSNFMGIIIPQMWYKTPSCQNPDSDMEMYQRKGNERKSRGPKIQFPCSQPNKIVALPKHEGPLLCLPLCVLDVIQPRRILLVLIIQTGTSSCKDHLCCCKGGTSKQPNKIAFS